MCLWALWYKETRWVFATFWQEEKRKSWCGGIFFPSPSMSVWPPLSFKLTGGGLCQVSYLILYWWVNKTRVISFSLQLIKLDVIDLEWGEGRGKNQKPGQLALKVYESFCKTCLVETFSVNNVKSVIKDGRFRTWLGIVNVISSYSRLHRRLVNVGRWLTVKVWNSVWLIYRAVFHHGNRSLHILREIHAYGLNHEVQVCIISPLTHPEISSRLPREIGVCVFN